MLVEETICRRIIDRMKRLRIEAETATKTLRRDAEIKHSRAAKASRFVDGKRPTSPHADCEVVRLRRWFGKIRKDLRRIQLASIAIHKTQGLAVLCLGIHAQAVRPSQKRLGGQRLVSIKRNFRAIGIRKRNPVKSPDRLGMLLRPGVVDSDWARVVLAEDIL